MVRYSLFDRFSFLCDSCYYAGLVPMQPPSHNAKVKSFFNKSEMLLKVWFP